MLEKTKSRASVVGELFGFLKKRKMWWLIPLIAMLLVVGLLLILATVSPAFAPFIYTLF
jgi:hypothetical protein